MGLFSRRKKEVQPEYLEPETHNVPVAETSDAAPTAQTASKTFSPSHTLNEDSGLFAVVQKMRSKGSGDLTLELRQTGNDMNLALFEDAEQKEEAVVVPGNEWFESIAALYVDEGKSGRGSFNRALIVLEGVADRVKASFMNSEKNTSHNLEFGLPSQGDHSAIETLSPQDRLSRVSQRIAEEEDRAPAESFSAVAFGNSASGEEYRVDTDLSAATDSAAAAPEDLPAEAPETSAPEEEPVGDIQETKASAQSSQSYASSVTSAHDITFASVTLPDDLHEEWDESAPEVPPAEVAEEPAGATGEDLPESLREADEPAGSAELPESGNNVDIAPSFSQHEQILAKPSTTELAEGNLVLTEAEVASRLAGVQENLFGEKGTARDVSTVLIRVRTLGSYYDALTHVRESGFWAQKRTFELIPEDELNVLQLKADSYKEGFGSPLAISIRLTPGIPPQVKFDYQDEGAFAKYSDELPAQQYVEELRMFPRTGANIPARMNRALASWTL